MKTNVLPFNDQVQSQHLCKIKRFWNSFNIPTILNRCRIRKAKGFAAKDIFHTLFAIPFLGMNFFNGVIDNKDVRKAFTAFLKNGRVEQRSLASTVVGMKYGGQAKIVFVRDKRKKD